MTIRRPLLLALFAAVAVFALSVRLPPAAVADGKADEKPKAEAKPKADAARPAELKVLDRWVGRWDMEMTIKPGPWSPAGSKARYDTSIAWDLNDRFIRCDAKGHSVRGEQKVDDSFLWICTWDPQKREYRSWVFWSVAGGEDAPAGMWGAAPVSTATWDEATKTLTTTSDDKETGVTSHGVTRWPDPDHHEFTATFKDAKGEVLMEHAGRATRRK